MSMVKHRTSCMNSACPPTSSQIPCSRSYMWSPDNRNLDSIFKFYIICKYSTWQMTIAIVSKPSNTDWLEEESKMTKQLWMSTKTMSNHKVCCLPCHESCGGHWSGKSVCWPITWAYRLMYRTTRVKECVNMLQARCMIHHSLGPVNIQIGPPYITIYKGDLPVAPLNDKMYLSQTWISCLIKRCNFT